MTVRGMFFSRSPFGLLAKCAPVPRMRLTRGDLAPRAVLVRGDHRRGRNTSQAKQKESRAVRAAHAPEHVAGLDVGGPFQISRKGARARFRTRAGIPSAKRRDSRQNHPVSRTSAVNHSQKQRLGSRLACAPQVLRTVNRSTPRRSASSAIRGISASFCASRIVCHLEEGERARRSRSAQREPRGCEGRSPRCRPPGTIRRPLA